MRSTLALIILIVTLSSASVCCGADWAQFRGPNRDGKSAETGLMKSWPAGGPELLWSVEGLGVGFSSAAIADGLVYTTGLIGKEKQGILFAFDIDGHLKWIASYGQEWRASHHGARTTPTVDGDRVYVFSGYGNAVCFDAKTGKQIWAVDTLEKFKGKNLKWGLSESVLVYDNKVICTPGGQDATIVALDKMTGETIWTTKGLSEKAAYCSAIIVEAAGRELILSNVQKSIVFIDPVDGKVVCRVPHEKRHDLAAVSPIYDKGRLYVTTGYEREDFPDRAFMFELSADLSSYTQKWSDRNLDCHHGGLIFLDGNIHGTNSVIYGAPSKEKDRGTWFCMDLVTGRLNYKAKLVGKGSVIWAEGLLYCYGENSKMGLVRPPPTGYEIISSFEITKGSDEHWAHPSISNGRLYIRHGNAMMAYDIRGK